VAGPQQHPVPGQDPQPRPARTEANIQYHAVADENMVCHNASPPVRHQPGSGYRSCHPAMKVRQRSAGILAGADDPAPVGTAAGRWTAPQPPPRSASHPPARRPRRAARRAARRRDRPHQVPAAAR